MSEHEAKPVEGPPAERYFCETHFGPSDLCATWHRYDDRLASEVFDAMLRHPAGRAL